MTSDTVNPLIENILILYINDLFVPLINVLNDLCQSLPLNIISIDSMNTNCVQYVVSLNFILIVNLFTCEGHSNNSIIEVTYILVKLQL